MENESLKWMMHEFEALVAEIEDNLTATENLTQEVRGFEPTNPLRSWNDGAHAVFSEVLDIVNYHLGRAKQIMRRANEEE